MNKLSLIVPAAGKSTRFPNMRPKFLLTHPRGSLMLIESISNIDLNCFDAIYFTVLREHLDKFGCENGLNKAILQAGLQGKAKLVIIDKPTSCQPETIRVTIEQENIKGSIFIKDVDNQFECKPINKNSIVIYDLNLMDLVNPRNKSYVNINENLLIDNIVEKQVTSPYFCCGGYSFESVNVFNKYYDKISKIHGNDFYISHIIYAMLLDNIVFTPIWAQKYEDWGTDNDWQKYRTTFATLFVDIDGTLIYASAEYFEPSIGNTKAIQENINYLNKLHNTGRIQIILTTARKKEYEIITKEQLKKCGLKYDDILFGIFHSKRIIINDYSDTNPYPSCEAINVIRDSIDIETLLRKENFNV